MSDPYRDSQPSISCARCGRPLPPGDLSVCTADCGAWLNAEAASRALAAAELAPSRLTSWSRERAACPICGTQMTLRGHDMTLFLGCDGHGFWIDRETVTQTGLGHPRNTAWLADARARSKALVAEQRRTEEAEREAAAKREREREREESEAAARAWHEKNEREKAERREMAARAAAREPYASALREMIRTGFPDEIADLLARQDRQITKLSERVVELERQLAAART